MTNVKDIPESRPCTARVVRVDTFSVPRAHRAAYDELRRRAESVVRTQPGLDLDLVLERPSPDPLRVEVVTIVAWRDEAAFAAAGEAVRAAFAAADLDVRARLAELGVTLDRRDYQSSSEGCPP